MLSRVIGKVNLQEWRQIQNDKNVSLIHGSFILQDLSNSENGLHGWKAEIPSFLMIYYTKGILKIYIGYIDFILGKRIVKLTSEFWKFKEGS